MINPTAANQSNAAPAEFLKRVWTDEAFGARLDDDPRAALAEIGGRYPEDVEIRVLRDTETVKYLRIPAAVPEAKLPDDELIETFRGHFADDVEIRIARDTDTVNYLHVPVAPFEGEVSDAELRAAQGGCASLNIHLSAYFGGVTIAGLVGNSDPVDTFPPGTFD